MNRQANNLSVTPYITAPPLVLDQPPQHQHCEQNVSGVAAPWAGSLAPPVVAQRWLFACSTLRGARAPGLNRRTPAPFRAKRCIATSSARVLRPRALAASRVHRCGTDTRPSRQPSAAACGRTGLSAWPRAQLPEPSAATGHQGNAPGTHARTSTVQYLMVIGSNDVLSKGLDPRRTTQERHAMAMIESAKCKFMLTNRSPQPDMPLMQS